MSKFCGLAVILLTISVAPPVAAEEIFKCVDGSRTVYQSTPCGAGAAETRMAPVAARAGARTPSSLSPRPSTGKSGPWKHQPLTLGMSDDEVLNMSGWGRPSRIDRVRLPREWREEWVYGPETPSERHLYFSNGRLVDMGDHRPDERMAEARSP
jgi:hypothetical protein